MAEVANGELARRLRAAARALILERGAPSVRFQHVRAHMGEPGNETADALAKAAGGEGVEPKHVPGLLGRAQALDLQIRRDIHGYVNIKGFIYCMSDNRSKDRNPMPAPRASFPYVLHRPTEPKCHQV